MVRRLLRPLAVAFTTASLVMLPLTNAPAHADSWGKGCKPKKYGTKYAIASANKAPVITHLSTYGIGPGVSRTVTKRVSKQTVVKAAVNYSSSTSVEAGLPGKILASASAKVNLKLAASGKHTSKKSSKVTERVSNKSKKNVQFVFYKGVTRAKGNFKKKRCTFYYLPGKNYGYYRVRIQPGKWRSYAVPGEGAVRCGSGTSGLGALAKAALKVGCRA